LYGHRFIEFLEIEHMNHAGQLNGKLTATYDQLSLEGIPRKLIRAAIYEACELGLVTVTEKGGRDHPSQYELNFYPVIGRAAMPNTWKRITREQAVAVKADAAAIRKTARGTTSPFKGNNSVHHVGTTLPPHAGTKKPRKAKLNDGAGESKMSKA